MDDYDICTFNKPGFILCSLVMVTVALVALFASYVVLSLVVPGYEGFAITAPAFVLAVFHYLLYDFVERMVAWRPKHPSVAEDAINVNHQ